MSYIVDPELFYDPYGEFRGKDGYLPLLDQRGKLQFVTFRCIDSIPAKQRIAIEQLKESFENVNPKPWTIDTLQRYY